MSELDFRRPTENDFAEFIAVSLQSYGSDASDAEISHERLSNELERSFGAHDGNRWAGGGGAFSLQATLPGGGIVPAAGVSMVGVAPTHRRRGILTRLIRQLHDDAAQRDEPIAVLTASESTIYRRFGYGVVADVAHVSIASEQVRFDPPVRDRGSFTQLDPLHQLGECAAIRDRARRNGTELLSLTSGMWEQIRADPPFNRQGRTPLRGVLHRDPAGNADGYALWRVAQHVSRDRIMANTIHIEQLTAESFEVEVALWAHLSSIDLATTIEWATGPPEPTIRWRLIEPRQLRVSAVTDMLWARILDVPRVLSARRFAGPGTIDLEINDRFHPDRQGRFRLISAGRNESGECRRVGHDEDNRDHAALQIDIADLASITFGIVAPSTLAATGRLSGPAELIDLADALFAVSVRPWWPIEF